MKTNAAAAWMGMPIQLDAAQILRWGGRGDGRSGSAVQSVIFAVSWLILFWCWALYPINADVDGIAPGVPEPKSREVIVQLFNWPFTKITDALPELKRLGYSHVHVSPPQQSNERVLTWWGRYQPVDFSFIKGPLGSEQEFREMNAVADQLDIKIIADAVLNHTIDLTDVTEGSVTFNPATGEMISYDFPLFLPSDFHPRCSIDDSNVNSVQKCWLDNRNADLKTETTRVRDIARTYLKKLVDLGVDGFRFDAAKHIEPDFFADVLAAVPDTFAFGEVIEADPQKFPQTDAIAFYDFPLVATMKQAFGFGGDLDVLRNPAAQNRALPGSNAVTFVRNHDIDRGQARDRGLHEGAQSTYGIGWNGSEAELTEADVVLAYAYIFGRDGGVPYVFVDMEPTTEGDKRKDRFNDGRVVSFIRFHNLCLDEEEGGPRPEETVNLGSKNALGWQRGKDRLVMINKSGEKLPLRNLQTTLRPGRYVEVHEGWLLEVRSDSTIEEWDLPAQTAAMFVLQG
jgi:alpha-amylase